PANPAPETTHTLQDLTPKRHVAPDKVADGGGDRGQPPVGAAHNPVELTGKPWRTAMTPQGLDAAADAKDLGVRIGGQELLQPIRRRNAVVIKEGDDRACRRRYPAVACSGQPLCLLICDRDHVGDLRLHTLE